MGKLFTILKKALSEHDPCLKSPIILLRDGKETIVEEGQTLRFLE